MDNGNKAIKASLEIESTIYMLTVGDTKFYGLKEVSNAEGIQVFRDQLGERIVLLSCHTYSIFSKLFDMEYDVSILAASPDIAGKILEASTKAKSTEKA